MRMHVVAMIALALSACSVQVSESAITTPPTVADLPGVTAWSLPTTERAAQPDLSLGPSNTLLLSWLEPDGAGGHRLQLGRQATDASAWRIDPIAASDRWFVNWADTPHVRELPDGSLWAHWLSSTGPSPMDYGIELVRSEDDGTTWSAPRMVNQPGTLGDHGFVSFWTEAPDRLGIAWLDSRQKPASDNAHGHDHHGIGAMMARAAIFDASLEAQAEWPLDTSTCDCCPTAAAMSSRGPVVVYRGRSETEVRDIRIVRRTADGWTAPRDVHADGWTIPGCPVNGPAVQASGASVWVAWYTEAGGLPSIRLALSNDDGEHFGAPIILAEGSDVLGRVALAATASDLIVAWLEEDTRGQRLMAARLLLLHDLELTIALGKVADLAARGRASGSPRLVAAERDAWLVWTDVEEGGPRLRGARLR